MKKHFLYPRFLQLVIACIFVSGCSSATNQTIPVATIIKDQENHLTLPSGLRIDEYTIKDIPEVDPLKFELVQPSQTGLLAKHNQEKQDKFPDNSFFEDMTFSRSATLNGQKLVARELVSVSGPTGSIQKVSIDVLRNDKVIYTLPAGDVSPVGALQGLWTYQKHWVLEIAYTEAHTNQNNVTTSAFGKLVQDGQLLNDQDDYQEMFGFQLINKQPFYFFKQGDQIGISYNNQKTMLGYAEIPHYHCCSAAELNPIVAQNMVAFFAQRNGNWYYVEIGIYP